MHSTESSQKQIHAASTNSDNVVTILGNYKIDFNNIVYRSIGKVICRGWIKNTKTPIIAKIIQFEGNHLKFNALAEQRIQSLKQLESKYFLEYIAVRSMDSKICLVAENIDDTLQNMMGPNTQMTESNFIQIFFQLCSILSLLKKYPQISYSFNPKDVFVLNNSVKLDCLRFYQKKSKQVSFYRMKEEDSQPQFHKILKMMSDGIHNIMLKSNNYKSESASNDRLEEILLWCKDPRKFRILSLEDLLVKLKNQISREPIKSPRNAFYRKIDKVLLNELNYIIFLQKLIKMLELEEYHKQQFSALIFIVKYNLKTKINKLNQVNHTNVYNMEQWNTYSRHKNFETYLQVIRKLFTSITDSEPPIMQDKRLKTIINNEYKQSQAFLLNYQFYLRKFISKLKSVTKLSSNKLAQSDKYNILLLDYLLSAYQINAINIEYYRDAYMFAMESYLDPIVKGSHEYDQKIAGFLSKKLQMHQF